jgi:pimeloyl-ACP methyl ester carboxylesterase/ribosomal protein S18 acetylase RimI-like enzyme
VIRIRLLSGDAEARACAEIMATSDPWTTLGRTFEMSLGLVRDPMRETHVALDGDAVIGFVVLQLRGPFTGYLQSIGVRADRRGGGIGARLLAHAERRIWREMPNVFICVSSFNPRAKALYLRSGYEEIGLLRDYVMPGYDEWLLRKTAPQMEAFQDGPMRQTHLAGASLARVERGAGEPIVFVHGALGDFRTMGPIARALAATHRTITYSRRGHYQSEIAHDGRAYDAETHADDLAELIESLGEPAHLVGHSYAGEVVARAAIRHPARVRSLVLVEASTSSLLAGGEATMVQRAIPIFRSVLDAAGSRDALAVVERMSRWSNGGQLLERASDVVIEIAMANWRTIRATLLGRARRELSFEDLARIAAPTTIMRGAQATDYFAAISRRLVEGIPGARAVVLDDVAHEPQWQNPEAFAAALRDALR